MATLSRPMPGIRRLLMQTRLSHSGTIQSGGKQVPPPRGNITDVESFLKRVGRGSEEYTSKFEDWNQLFSVSSRELKEFGIPTKARKFILSRVEFYRQGIDPQPLAVKMPKKK
ncbi:IGR protein motif-domain-containing protein [Umbelopsis sp. PMI_123]|nr:IGR protein motif-domain-containing protein [Umbelopsis sp. PMI_123]